MLPVFHRKSRLCLPQWLLTQVLCITHAIARHPWRSNPLGKVPFLEDPSPPPPLPTANSRAAGPLRLPESGAILTYLATKYHTPEHWYPAADLPARARVDAALHWCGGNQRCLQTFRKHPQMTDDVEALKLACSVLVALASCICGACKRASGCAIVGSRRSLTADSSHNYRAAEVYESECSSTCMISWLLKPLLAGTIPTCVQALHDCCGTRECRKPNLGFSLRVSFLRYMPRHRSMLLVLACFVHVTCPAVLQRLKQSFHFSDTATINAVCGRRMLPRRL